MIAFSAPCAARKIGAMERSKSITSCRKAGYLDGFSFRIIFVNGLSGVGIGSWVAVVLFLEGILCLMRYPLCFQGLFKGKLGTKKDLAKKRLEDGRQSFQGLFRRNIDFETRIHMR